MGGVDFVISGPKGEYIRMFCGYTMDLMRKSFECVRAKGCDVLYFILSLSVDCVLYSELRNREVIEINGT